MKITLHNQSFEGEPYYFPSGEFWSMAERGEWEPETFDILDKYVTPATTVLDVGAWIGPVSLYTARLCKQVYAYEPDSTAFTFLDQNLWLNSIENVETHRRAIAAQDGKLWLGGKTLGDSMTRYTADENLFEVPCSTLSSQAEDWEMSGPLFVKIDTEGAEELILQDFAFFEKYRPTLYLSLHPKWWVDPAKTRGLITRLKPLYWEAEIVSGYAGGFYSMLFSGRGTI